MALASSGPAFCRRVAGGRTGGRRLRRAAERAAAERLTAPPPVVARPSTIAKHNPCTLLNSRGRTAKRTPERDEIFFAELRLGSPATQAARAANYNEDTIWRWRRRYPDFAAAWSEAE